MANSRRFFIGVLFLGALCLGLYVLTVNQTRWITEETQLPRYLHTPEVTNDLHHRLAELSTAELATFSNSLVKLAHYIAIAKKHVRGTKAADALIAAQKEMTKNLGMLHVSYEQLVNRTAKPPVNVCPEVYKGRSFGYYLFDTGFVVENCTYAKSLDELVTVVFVYEDSQTYDVLKLLNSVREYHPKIPVIFGAKSSALLVKIPSSSVNVKKFSDFNSKSNMGEVWNKLMYKVKTPYTFIAHDVIWFNHDARLDRLIRMIERLDLSAAGGAFRDVNGSWFQGCQQRVQKNFTLVYEAGYDESFDECLFCDHIDGPFVMKTSEIQNLKFNENIGSQGLYEDLFLRLNKKENVVCPDAMFYTNRTERSYRPQDWNSFVQSWPTYKIQFSGRDIIIPTPSSYPCHNGKGTALTPWCQKENTDVTYASLDVCANLKLICELDSGSIMGAVKFHSVLPWERDADIVFLKSNFTVLANAKRTWANMGFKAVPEKDNYIGLKSKHWRLEMWGMGGVPSEPKRMHCQPPTMLTMGVKRVRAPRNPGLWARNRYGREIYQHAQHWGDAGDQNYRVKQFLPCVKPGNQDCLDRYNSDGNMQFNDPIP